VQKFQLKVFFSGLVLQLKAFLASFLLNLPLELYINDKLISCKFFKLFGLFIIVKKSLQFIGDFLETVLDFLFKLFVFLTLFIHKLLMNHIFVEFDLLLRKDLEGIGLAFCGT